MPLRSLIWIILRIYLQMMMKYMNLFINSLDMAYSFCRYRCHRYSITRYSKSLQGCKNSALHLPRIVLGRMFPNLHTLAKNPNYGPFDVWIGLLASVVVAGILFTLRTYYIQHYKPRTIAR